NQSEVSNGEEIGPVNVSDGLLEKARAIHVPNVICWRRRICQWRAIRKTAATHAPHAEMLQTCRRAEDSVASAIERRNPVGEISHSIAIVFIRCALVEQIAINVGCDH